MYIPTQAMLLHYSLLYLVLRIIHSVYYKNVKPANLHNKEDLFNVDSFLVWKTL